MNLPSTRRGALRLMATALATSTIGLPAIARASSPRRGSIFISTNAPAGNELLVFAQDDSGLASPVARVPTQGLGTGGGLGSQGAVTLSRNGRHLFVVNAASNTVSTFALRGRGMVLSSVVDSGGLMPTSVTEHAGLVYVLNAGGNGNVAGFRNLQGVLTPLDDGIRGLSAAGGTAPAQVGLSSDGDVLVVAERNTNLLSSYAVAADGSLGARVSTASPGLTPFGFAFTRRDHLIVSEAGGGAAGASSASSYRFERAAPTTPSLVSGAVPTTQTAACWVAVTPDGRFAYTSNAGSSSISSFAVARGGALRLLQAQAGLTGENAGALDAAVTPDGQHFHVFASRSLQIVSFAVGDDGTLTALGAVGGLPAGAAGLAAN